MGHVDAEGLAVLEHRFEIAEIAVGIAEVVRGAPGVEPAGVEFAAHEWAMRKNFAEGAESAGGVGAEIDDGEKIVAIAVVEMLRGIAGEEGDVEAAVEEGLADFAHILFVFGEEAVFVFDLDHEDGAAVSDLEGSEDSADFVEIGFGGVEKFGIARAESDVGIFEKPPGEAAHFPFGAGVGAGAEDDPEAFFLCDAAELRGVGLAGPVEVAGRGFLEIPEEIGADGVEAHGFGGAETVSPIFHGDARGVDFAAADFEALVVEEEIVVANGECVVHRFGSGGQCIEGWVQ